MLFDYKTNPIEAIREEFRGINITLDDNMIYNLIHTPPYDDVASVRIDSSGIYYNDIIQDEKLLILTTSTSRKSRGLSFNITNMDNWIDLASESTKENLRIFCLSNNGNPEPMLMWNN